MKLYVFLLTLSFLLVIASLSLPKTYYSDNDLANVLCGLPLTFIEGSSIRNPPFPFQTSCIGSFLGFPWENPVRFLWIPFLVDILIVFILFLGGFQLSNVIVRRLYVKKKGVTMRLIFIASIVLLFALAAFFMSQKAKTPLPKPSFHDVVTYANTYITYTMDDLEKLKKFDIVMIEPYNVPNSTFLHELKESGTIIIAYISVGEADNERRYWEKWHPTERAFEISHIPRTTIDEKHPMFIGEDPGWPGSYFVDASNLTWQQIILDEELPYILALGDNQYDGIVMDLIDVVDEYEGHPREEEMRQGLIDLIKKIDNKYPNLLIIPNRGFGIIDQMAPYIDAFKFEELTRKYNNIPGEENYGLYTTQFDREGAHENQEQIDDAVRIAKRYNIPIFVLDHVETAPPDILAAKKGYDEAKRLSEKYGVKFIWYANSVDQDLPLWDFLPL